MAQRSRIVSNSAKAFSDEKTLKIYTENSGSNMTPGKSLG